MHFLMPSLFNDLDSFKVWFKGVDWDALKSAEGTKGRVADMHALLRPFLLRRMKADVALSLPTKKEILLSVGACTIFLRFQVKRCMQVCR